LSMNVVTEAIHFTR